MMKAKCIAKARDKNNQIIGYKLQDQQGNITIVKPEALKSAIKAKKIEIINLTLTSDNRLIDTTPKTQPASKSMSKVSEEEQKVKILIEKAKVLGYQITEIPTYCSHKCILISKDKNNHILYIPDNVVRLNGTDMDALVFTQHIEKLQGHIKVIGGHNLKDANNMFFECQAQSLDLSSFDTSSVTNMCYMFYACRAQSIDLSSFDTSNVTDMHSMFYACQAQSLDLSSFDTSSVTDMRSMFEDCQAQSLDLSNFNTSNVTNMESMFCKCKAQSLDLSNFDTSNVTDMCFMFYKCQVQSLDLSNFDTSNVESMHGMFDGCQAQSLNLSSFDTRKVTGMRSMFEDCKAQSLDLSSFDISNVIDMRSMFEDCKAQYLDLSSFNTSNEIDMSYIIEKVKALGYQIAEIPTYCKHKCMLISEDKNNHVLYVPDDVVRLNGTESDIYLFSHHIRGLQGHIDVIGGHNVTDMSRLFEDCKAQSLDISSFDTGNAKDMSNMFRGCTSQLTATDPKILGEYNNR